jgi:hypothetical protein
LSKKQTFQILTIVSVIGIICWNITDYFGGMIIYLLQYWIIIIPIVILYLITLIGTIIKLSKSGIKENKLIFGAHIIFIIFLLITNLIESEIFKSKIVLSGTLKDDLFHYTLIFREDGTCENNVNGFLGFEETYNGKYKMVGDTIIFNIKPYDNDFIPDTLLLDKKENAIFISKDKEGKFSTKKEWLNHFVVEKTTGNNGYN